jgi:nucleotide-binding universal stress UspA family protein
MTAHMTSRRRTRRPSSKKTVTSRMLVASDGTASSDQALRLAALLAARDGGRVRVVSALVPLPAVSAGMTGFGMMPFAPIVDSRQVSDMKRRVENQILQTTGQDWESRVDIGDAASVILREATDWRATMIVVGIGRHSPVDRLLGSEIALHVARRSRVPVLAAGSHIATAPGIITSALDFSTPSDAATRAALELLGPDGTLQLVHVGPDFAPSTPDHGAGWGELYRTGVRARLTEFIDALEAPAGLTVQPIDAHGDTVRSLLAYASAAHADVIAVGAQRHSRLERLFVGSVSAKVLRGATCSVLVTPPDWRFPKRRRAAAVRQASS